MTIYRKTDIDVAELIWLDISILNRYIQCVPEKNVHLFIFQITLSKINRF